MILIGPDFRFPPPQSFGPLQVFFLILALQAVQEGQRSYFANYTLTSYYRDLQRNRAVGGVEGSLHTLGLALDVTTDARGLSGFFTFITNNQAQRTALGNIVRAWKAFAPPLTQGILEDDHAHLELDLA